MKDISIRTSQDDLCCFRQIETGDIRLVWEITNRCNMQCKHCFIDQSDIRSELNTQECFAVIDDFKNFPVGKVMLTGGEPFLRKDIFEIVERIKSTDENILMDITTNMTLLDCRKIEYFTKSNIDELTTSLDGNREVHDEIRGQKGNFDHVISMTKRLRKMNLKVDLVSVINKMNFKMIGEIIDIGYSTGFSSITVSGLIRRGTNSNMEYLALSKKDIHEVITVVDTKRKEYGSRFAIRTVAIHGGWEGMLCNINNVICLNHKGDVARCFLTSDDRMMIYNVRNNKLSDIYDKLGNVKCILV